MGDLVQTDARSPDDAVLERVDSRSVRRRLLATDSCLPTYRIGDRAALCGRQAFEKTIALCFGKVHELLRQSINPDGSIRVWRSTGPQRQWFVVGGSTAGDLGHDPHVRPVR